jgi:hypothetical protein
MANYRFLTFLTNKNVGAAISSAGVSANDRALTYAEERLGSRRQLTPLALAQEA